MKPQYQLTAQLHADLALSMSLQNHRIRQYGGQHGLNSYLCPPSPASSDSSVSCRAFFSRKEGPYPWKINPAALLRPQLYFDTFDAFLSKLKVKVIQGIVQAHAM